MSGYFDSHAHFENVDEIRGIVDRAHSAGVTSIMAVGGSAEDDEIVLEAARLFPGVVCAAVGRGRHLAGELQAGAFENAMAELDRTLSESGAVALGEIGLDFHYERDTADAQIELFRTQLEMARGHGLPVIVHSREAQETTLRELREHAELWRRSPGAGRGGIGVVHCFTGDAEFARELLGMGYYLGFSGIITFKNAGPLREVLRTVPDDRLLIETDAPYLAPVPHRGKRNEPAYLSYVAATTAEVRGVSAEHIAGITFGNAARLFGVDAGPADTTSRSSSPQSSS